MLQIPVDEDGNQIGPQITEYEASESGADKPDSTASVPQFQQVIKCYMLVLYILK